MLQNGRTDKATLSHPYFPMLMKFFRTLIPGRDGAAIEDSLHLTSDANARAAMALAAQMLAAPSALLPLSPQEALVVVRFMRPLQIAQGTVFIREGDGRNTGFLVLVLDGEVTVESIVVSRVSPITVTVLGPGSMHGDMGLIDGLPRSASCTASTDLQCAVLSRDSVLQLLEKHPKICAKLMIAISVRIGERLRDNTEKLKKYVQLTKAMQEEIDHLMPK
jgi:CRP-like cAMP-binding protein